MIAGFTLRKEGCAAHVADDTNDSLQENTQRLSRISATLVVKTNYTTNLVTLVFTGIRRI